MANTYTLISGSLLSSTTASVTFSSIPQTYTDLLVKTCVRTSRSNFIVSTFEFQLNGDTTGIYSLNYMSGSGTTFSASNAPDQTASQIVYTAANTATANTFGNTEIYFPSYTNSAKKVTSSISTGENNATASYLGVTAHLAQLTSAIDSIRFFSNSGYSFLADSSFYLYGIKNS
jgi:hypothetical protein